MEGEEDKARQGIESIPYIDFYFPISICSVTSLKKKLHTGIPIITSPT